MPAPPHGNPLLRAFLRALAFVGPIEAVFFRLIPPPSGIARTTLERAHEAANRAGFLTFLLSSALAIVLLIALSRIAMTSRIWPGGLNGFLAVCMTIQAALGIGAWIGPEGPGPAFAIAFTLISLMAVTAMGAHAHATMGGFARMFLVLYVSSVLCSAVTTVASFGHRLGVQSMPEWIVAASYTAGFTLLCLSAVIAFVAFADTQHLHLMRETSAIFAIVVAAAASLGFAALCLLAGGDIALLGPHPSVPLVLLASFAIFAGTLSIALNLLNPERRLIGYGLLLLMLAGFPQRLALQDMLVVLGAALLLAPRRREMPIPTISFPPEAGGYPLPGQDPQSDGVTRT